MVFIIDGSSDYDAQVWGEPGNLISLRHLYISKAASKLKQTFFSLHTRATCSGLPSHVNPMTRTREKNGAFADDSFSFALINHESTMNKRKGMEGGKEKWFMIMTTER